MTDDITPLFRRIQDQALDSSVPITDTLRLCVAAGGRIGAPELIGWAQAELQGYDLQDDLPAYRTVHAPLLMDYQRGPTWAKGQQVPASLVDESFRPLMHDVPLRDPLHSLDAMARANAGEAAVHLTSAAAGTLERMVQRRANESFLGVSAVYWSVSRASIGAVVDQVRTRLVEMVANFDVAITSAGVDVGVAARNAVSITVTDGGLLTVNNAPGATVVSGGDKSVVTSSSAGRDVAATTVGGSVVEDGQQARTPRFWETSWWTIGRAAGGVLTIVIAAIGVYIAYQQL